MLKIRSSVLALASLFIVSNLHAQYADSVVSYTPGSGVNPSFTDPSRSLGAPTSFIGYQNADPFNPPYQSSHLVSIGEGGTLTVQFSTAIPNDSSHSYGLDFLIFGNSGFIITNGDYSGGGITDGSLFANNPGSTRVWVSADNLNYYVLNPALAPVVDGFFPTDADGNFGLAVNPVFGQGDFTGKDLTAIRSMYAGSGGGTGYDISWAQDGGGASVSLPNISFVRIEVLSGKSEVDAFSVVPEPAVWVIGLIGAGLWIRRGQKKGGS